MSRAVMTIHGFLTDTSDFGRLCDYLDFYDEIAVCEIPGHNGEVDFSLFTVESTLIAVTACYDNLRKKHDRVDVVGFSMGGALATYLEATRDVRKCVLLSPANKYINPSFIFDAMKFYAGVRRKTYKSTDGKSGQKRSAVKESMRLYKRNARVSYKIAFGRILPNLNRRTYKVFTKLINIINKTIDNADCKIATPTLIMRGTLDELVPRRSIEYLKEHFSNCVYEQLDGVRHGMLYTNRDNLIITKIVEFLSDGEIVPDVPFREV